MFRFLGNFSPFSSKAKANSPLPSSHGSRSERGSRGAVHSTRSNGSLPSRRSNRSRPTARSNASEATISIIPRRRRWRRYVPYIGFSHALMMLITTGVVFISLILAGCTANGLRNIYLLSLSYNDHTGSSDSNISTAIQSIVGNTTHTLEVRIGFLGACVRLPLEWFCSPDFKTTTNRVSEVFAGTNTSSAELYDPLGLLHIGGKFENEVIFGGLMYIAVGCSFVSFCLLITLKTDLVDEGSSEVPEQSSNSERSSGTRQKKRTPVDRESILKIVFWFAMVSAVMTLLSVFWQHLGSAGAATMIDVLTGGAVRTRLGAVSMGLGWTAVVLNTAVFLGARMSIVVMRRLSALSD